MTERYPDGGVTLQSCDLEPIHIIGQIQNFGWLVALSSDWIVQRVSLNCGELLGQPAEAVTGTPANMWFTPAAIEAIRHRLANLVPQRVERIFALDLTHDRRRCDVAIWRSGRVIVLEVEPASGAGTHDYLGLVRPMLDAVRRAATPESLYAVAAKQMRRLTGFDRVKVYRFDETGAGEVLGESRADGVDSFLGLHFPASDIPQQARRLYRENLLRMIADVDAPTVPIHPALDANGEPLDLSASGLRAVSPVHVEYLRNMGVHASMSVSIMRHGALWGLFACHHYSPLTLSHATRTAAELFGEFFASTLDQVQARTALRLRDQATLLHDRMMAQVASGGSLLDTFDSFSDMIREVIPFDGIVGFVDGEFLSRGSTPDRAQFTHLARFLNTTGTGTCWSSVHLAEAYPAAAAFGERAAGLLSIPVSRTPRDYVVLFRGPHAQSVNWAGNPNESKTVGPMGDRLTPRKSFALWQEERRQHAKPWTASEVATAESIRVTLIEVILHLMETSAQERNAAARRQQDLIAELNHRVRNSLNLISGLVNQGRRNAPSVPEFAAAIAGRIQALARAHDMVNATNWAPYPIADLVRTEVAEVFPGATGRLQIAGVKAMIRPSGFTTLAVVVHELVSTSAALATAEGRAEVTLTQTARGELMIEWRENAVSEAQRPLDGVAQVILERSIPYELGGSAHLTHGENGLVATFTIPADRVDIAEGEAATTAGPRGAAPVVCDAPRLLSARALIVEDNVIIGLEAEDQLFSMGAATIDMASTVSHALDLVGRNAYEFALLDINLGNETSERVAEALSRQGTPYAFTTGYGEVPWARNAGAHVTAPVVTKPLDTIALERAISAAMALRG